LSDELMEQNVGIIGNELRPYIFASCFTLRDVEICRHNNFETGLM
jgi:hypothetical protein